MEFFIGQRVVVPSLDKGGIVVAINEGTYTVDFDRGETQAFTADELQLHL